MPLWILVECVMITKGAGLPRGLFEQPLYLSGREMIAAIAWKKNPFGRRHILVLASRALFPPLA